MLFWRWILYGTATWLLLIGLWQHDWRMILAGLSVWLIYPLISEDIDEVALPECSGCQRHYLIPGCPLHDPEERNAAANGEDSQTRKGTGASVA